MCRKGARASMSVYRADGADPEGWAGPRRVRLASDEALGNSEACGQSERAPSGQKTMHQRLSKTPALEF